MIRLATVFSGIGAIEHAFQRLKLKHKIVFAGDIDDKCKKGYFANYDIAEENEIELQLNNIFTALICRYF